MASSMTTLPSWASSVVFSQEEMSARVLTRKLYTVAVQWWQLGLQLNLHPEFLEGLEVKDTVQAKFGKMLQHWITDGEDHYRTWGALANAVDESGHRALGRRVRRMEHYREGSRADMELLELTDLLHQLAPQWKTLAINLGLPLRIIDSIDNKRKAEDCLFEVLNKWLNRPDKNEEEPTFEVLYNALRSSSVANTALAIEILNDVEVLQLLTVSENGKEKQSIIKQQIDYIAKLKEGDRPSQQEPGPVLDHSPETDPEKADQPSQQEPEPVINHPLETDPEEAANKELIALMKKYKDQPIINYKSLKFSFLGPPRVGKTITRMRLTEEIVNIARSGLTTTESTTLEKPIAVQMYEKSDISPALLGKSWENSDWLGEMQLLLHQGHKQEDPKPKDSAEEDLQNDPQQLANNLISTPVQNGNSPRTKQKQDEHSTSLSLTYVEKMTREVLENRGLKKIEDMEGVVTAYFMDFGGQPEFLDVLSLVLRGPALHLVFFNASLDLDKPVHVQFCPPKESTDTYLEYDTKYTTSQMLSQIVSSLYHLSKTRCDITLPSGKVVAHIKPTAVLIGTHIDQPTNLDKVNGTLEELFPRRKFLLQGFLWTPSHKELLFYPLDNQKGTEEEIQDLQEFLRKRIDKELEPTPMPKSWLTFHIALRHRYEKDGLCSMKDCVELASQCDIEERDVKPILKYIHHHIGNVLHYADVDGLQNIVFCEPNKLLEAINRVIILSFVCDKDDKHLGKEIREFGEVPDYLLTDAADKAVESTSITKKHVISLLKHAKIITKIPGTETTFFPCLLKPDPSVTLPSLHDIKHFDPTPLLIQFRDGYIPLGLFSKLAVELVSEHKWEFNDQAKRFKDHFKFIACSCSVEFFDHVHFLEIRIVDPLKGEALRPMFCRCQSIKESVRESIAPVVKSCGLTKGIEFDLGSYCQCGQPEPHFCKFIRNSNLYHCSKKEEGFHLIKNGDMWFGNPKLDGTSRGDDGATASPLSSESGAQSLRGPSVIVSDPVEETEESVHSSSSTGKTTVQKSPGPGSRKLWMGLGILAVVLAIGCGVWFVSPRSSTPSSKITGQSEPIIIHTRWFDVTVPAFFGKLIVQKILRS